MQEMSLIAVGRNGRRDAQSVVALAAEGLPDLLKSGEDAGLRSAGGHRHLPHWKGRNSMSDRAL